MTRGWSTNSLPLPARAVLPALLILDTLLSDGNSLSACPERRRPPPIRVAPPSQLALLSTLVVHPAYTSRAPEHTNPHIAARALAYLRGVLAVAGPVNANLRAAFEFRGIWGGGASGRPQPERRREQRIGRRRRPPGQRAQRVAAGFGFLGRARVGVSLRGGAPAPVEALEGVVGVHDRDPRGGLGREAGD